MDAKLSVLTLENSWKWLFKITIVRPMISKTRNIKNDIFKRIKYR